MIKKVFDKNWLKAYIITEVIVLTPMIILFKFLNIW
jgi:hypothetical protein